MQLLSPLRPVKQYAMSCVDDPRPLDGRWRLVFCLCGDQERAWSEQLELRGNIFSANHDSPATGRIVLKENRGKLSEIDFVYSMDCGLHSGDRIEGIYRLIDDQVLLINLGVDAAGEAHYARPASFAPTKVSTLLVLVREI